MLFVGCAENELPSFPESKAFIAFTRSSLSINEITTVKEQIPIESDIIDVTGKTKTVKDTTYTVQDSLMIEVLCSSMSGVDASVEFEIIPQKSVVDSTVVTYQEKGVLDKDSIWVHKVNGVDKADTLHAGDSIMFTRDSVKVIITDKGAKVGEQFTFTTTCGDSTTVLTFDKDHIKQYIIIKPIDNSTFDGDKFFTVKLKNVQGAELGASNSCDVTVADDEHPLAHILGMNVATGVSHYDGAMQWNIRIDKDPDGDPTKLYLVNFFNGTANYSPALYAIADKEKGTFSIPNGQVIVGGYYIKYVFYKNYTAENGKVKDEGTEFEVGESAVGKLAPDGTITLPDICIIAEVYNDSELGDDALLGYWDITFGPIVIKKK